MSYKRTVVLLRAVVLLMVIISILNISVDAGNISPGVNNTTETLLCGGDYIGEPISSNTGDSVTFNMTVIKPANITWYKNIFKETNATDVFDNTTEVFNETNKTTSLYAEAGTQGKWNITAIANYISYCNQNSTKTWTWTVTTSTNNDGGGGGNGGSSGGGGGGGAASDEPFENIAKIEKRDGNLNKDAPVVYSFTTPELAIYQVIIIGKESENDVPVRIESLKNTSKLVNQSAPGIVYVNDNIFIKTYRASDIKVRFKINNSWISANNLKDTDIGLFKWNVSQWVPLETKMINKDGIYTYFESGINGTSRLAISGKGGTFGSGNYGKPTSTVKTGKPTSTKIPIPNIEKKSPGFEWLSFVLVLVILISIFKVGKGKN